MLIFSASAPRTAREVASARALPCHGARAVHTAARPDRRAGRQSRRARPPACRWRRPACRSERPKGARAVHLAAGAVRPAGAGCSSASPRSFRQAQCMYFICEGKLGNPRVARGGGSRGGAPPHTARSRRLAGRRSGARGGSRDPCPLLPTVGDIMRTASNCQVAKSSMLSSNLAKRHIRKTALNIKIKLSSRLRRERLKSHPLHAQGPHHRIARGSCRKHRRPKRTQG